MQTPRSTLGVAVMFFMVLAAAPAAATPTIQTLSNGFLISNGLVSITFNTAGGVYGGYDGITSIIFDGQQMVGSKAFYYDVQGSPNIYLNSTATWSYRTGSNFIDLSAEMPATTSQPVDVTWHWIIGDGQAGYSSYITYNHTAAMADWQSTENRLGAQFDNDSLFNYSSITDNFWGYQAADEPDRGEGAGRRRGTSCWPCLWRFCCARPSLPATKRSQTTPPTANSWPNPRPCNGVPRRTARQGGGLRWTSWGWTTTCGWRWPPMKLKLENSGRPWSEGGSSLTAAVFSWPFAGLGVWLSASAMATKRG